VHSSRRRRRRSHKLLGIVVLVVIVLGAGGSALGYVTLKGRADELQARLVIDLQAGERELEAGKASLTQANTKRDASLVTEAVAHFVAAKGQFVAAGQLADNSRLLRDLEALPGVGSLAQSRHTAVDGIAEMGAAISDAGQELSDLYVQLIKPAASGQAARTVLTLLDQTKPGLAKVRADFDRAQQAATQVDVGVLPAGEQSTFMKARDTVASALSSLDELDRLVPVLREVLGGNGTRTYLIEQVNPAELRAGGGFIGTYSLVRVDQGAVTLIQSGTASSLAEPRPMPGQAGFIPQPGPYHEVIPDISWSFLDSNLFPDFASSARAALSFVQPRLETKVDGVISIDYYTVAKLLELTGPLLVPGYGLTVDASNFIPQIIQHDIGDSSHYAIVSALARPLMERVSTLPPERWPALIGALNGLAAERHLQLYVNNDLAEKEIDRVGWSGGVNPAGAKDYMMEVESNYGGSKANYWVSRHYTLVLTHVGSWLHHKVTIDLVNATPCGSNVRTYYRVNVRLYVGANASSVSDSLVPVGTPNPAPPSGTQLLDGWLPDIACGGGRGQAVYEYDTPLQTQIGAIHEIYWQKQPGTATDKIDVSWSDGHGHMYTASGDLGQDRVITLTPTGVTLTAGQPAQAPLPSLSLG
jgi:hypothetical protein